MVNKKPLLIALIILVIAIAALLVIFIKKPVVDIAQEAAPDSVPAPAPSAADMPEPIDWKSQIAGEFKIEFMNDVEKTTMNIPQETKVQVLARDENGKILAYKIITSDADIVTSLEE
jgi:hypothetical protein